MRSRRVVFTWELGGGLGHLVRMAPLVQRLVASGNHVTLVVRDLSRVATLLGELKIPILQSPVKLTPPQPRIDPPRSFAHILWNSGFGDYTELCGLTSAWRNLFEFLKPDLVLCDHSPTALLTASGMGIATATLGTGFLCPPDVSRLPDLRPWMPDAAEQLRADEAAVLERVNRLRDSWGAAAYGRLGQLFSDVRECFLCTFRELDSYPMRPLTRYLGIWGGTGGAAPIWPAGTGPKRVFVYLRPFPGLEGLLSALNQLQVATLVHCDRIDPALKERFASPAIVFCEELFDLEQVGRQADLAILHAGHGAVARMLLAGTPVLQIPMHLEQTHNAHAIARLGAGLVAAGTDAPAITAKLLAMLNSDRFAQAARQFASRYERFDPQESLNYVAERVQTMLGGGSPRRPTGPAKAQELVVVIGTGRCGLARLGKILNKFPSTLVVGQCQPPLAWATGNEIQAGRRLATIIDSVSLSYPSVRHLGLVGHVYLSHLEELLSERGSVRVVCVQRRRAATIDSFLRYVCSEAAGGAINHWSLDRQGLEDHPWDASFPKYPTTDVAAALGQYWDDYYHRAASLAERFPGAIRMVSAERLFDDPDELQNVIAWLVGSDTRAEGSRDAGEHSGILGEVRGRDSGDQILLV